MPDKASYEYRPYPRQGQGLRCQQYVDEIPPASSRYRLLPESDHRLVSLVSELRQYPIRQAVDRIVNPSAPARPPVAVSSLSNRRPDNHSRPPVAVGLLDRPADPEVGIRDDNVDDPPTGDIDTHPNTQVILAEEGVHYTLNRKQQRVFKWFAGEGSEYIAVDEDNRELVGDDGEWIYVTTKGVAVDDRAGTKEFTRKIGNLIRSGGATTEELADDIPPLFDENGAPVENFTVPAIGKSPVVTSRVWGGRRLAFLIAVVTVMSAFFGLVGVMYGRSAVPADGAISANEATQYRLTSLPLQAMSAFGQQYLQTCLTHGDASQVAARAKLLASMSTGGPSPSCGWQDGGKIQAPQMIVFNGRAKSIDGFTGGAAAYLFYNVSMAAGDFWTVSVPIWVSNTAQANDMSVIGDIGITAGLRTSKPSGYQAVMQQDSRLAGELQSSLLAPFLTAWAASDDKQITLAATDNAEPEVHNGLGGALENPRIQQVTVFTSNAQPNSGPIVYNDGDVVIAQVTVQWDVKQSSSTQTAGYRIALRKVGGKWLISDIAGGTVSDHAADANPIADSTDGINTVDAGVAPTGGAVTTTPSTSEPTTSQDPDSAATTSESTSP